MEKRFGRMVMLAVLVIGLAFNTAAAAEETGASPETVVKHFTKAYFMLDRSLGDYLSRDARVNENQADLVSLFFSRKTEEARSRGYDLSYFQMRPLLIKTKVLASDDTSAKVSCHIVALRSVNPLFRIVGYIFGLIEEQRFEDTLLLVKEEGRWKVGPGAFDMPL